MNLVLTKDFNKEVKQLLKKYPSLGREIVELGESIKANPIQGTPIGQSCYKIRLQISSKGKGKSGGARVITYVHVIGDIVYLLSIYDKSEKENISESELKRRLQDL
jgi:mRNA-degrading endonuclease RelE of RelBE toxin-antitoxin system